jgi:hypothetical protein
MEVFLNNQIIVPYLRIFILKILLLDLPNELLQIIAEHLDSERDVNAASSFLRGYICPARPVLNGSGEPIETQHSSSPSQANRYLTLDDHSFPRNIILSGDTASTV